MRFVRICTALIALFCSACSLRGITPAPEQPITEQRALSAEQFTPFTSVATSMVYVPNYFANSVTAYTSTASGNLSPIRNIVGTNTHLDKPIGILVSSVGVVYVSNQANNTITEFTVTSTGNVAPSKIISCGGLNNPHFMALDSSSNLYVANFGNASISVFAPSAHGCVNGNRTIKGSNTKLTHPAGLLISGATLYVSNWTGATITEYAVTASGNTPPMRMIAGTKTGFSSPYGLARDASGNL